jgi:hypothetical protein
MPLQRLTVFPWTSLSTNVSSGTGLKARRVEIRKLRDRIDTLEVSSLPTARSGPWPKKDYPAGHETPFEMQICP